MLHRFTLLLSAVTALSVCLFAQTYDGPAQLPVATVNSSMADTPAPGSIINVSAGDDLQAALNRAQCGDTIQLQAGATFTGRFKFPARNCDNSNWIIVRTSSPDTALPTEGRRITPCYAGVSSLLGRPAYACDNPQNVLARLMGSSIGPVVFLDGANHYRLIGLEITRPEAGKGAPTLMSVAHGGAASYIVLDRSWVHGTTQDETQDGFNLSGTKTVAVVDSYFSDFHCTSRSGSCTEAHAVSGGIGNYQDGPYKIEDNFLEASSQAILFGGAAATLTPTDIVIRFNHFFKPWQWMKGNVPFQGGVSGDPFIVRHHLEFKNASRVLVENNLMENVWGGFAESGYAVLLTPKNQHTKSGNNVCPVCQVTDVTIRYAHIFHAGGGIVMATARSGDKSGGGAPALAGARFSIHDVVIDDISKRYIGGARLFSVSNGWPTNPLNTITIDHVTGFQDANGALLSVGNQNSNPQMYGFVFTNNIVTTGRYPVWSVGGGKTGCAYSGTPAQKIANCFASYTFSNNALIAAPAQYPPSAWPDGNLFSADMTDVRFVQCDGGDGGDYQLQPDSPYKNKGTDGKDLGADIAGLNQALAGID
jgi:hypothetical protein